MKVGIGYKIGLLLVLLIALAALVVPQRILRDSQEVLVRHKIVDLKDEVNVLARDLEAKIRGFRQRVLQDGSSLSVEADPPGGHGQVAARSDAWGVTLRRFLARDDDYLEVRVVALGEGGGPQTVVLESRPGILGLFPHVLDEDNVLRDLVSRAESDGVVLSQVRETTVTHQDPAGHSELQPVLWAGMRLGGQESRTDPSEPSLFLIAALDLGPQLDAIDESPRHLSFVIDGSGRFLVHPDWSQSLLGRNSRLHTVDHDATFDEPQLFQRADRKFREPGDDEERRSLDRRGWRWIPTGSQDGREDDQWLRATTAVWYQQSRLLSPPTAHNDGLRGSIKAILRDLRDEMRRAGYSHVRIECFTSEVPRIRIQAASRDELDQATDRIGQEVMQRLDPGLRAVLAEDRTWGRWENPVRCRRYAMHFRQAGVSGGVPDGPQDRFLVAQAVSADVLESELWLEMHRAVVMYLVVAGICAVLAFPFSLLLVRPLRRITDAAEAFAKFDFRSDSWPPSISEAAESLPGKRRDEIGILARAFGRMMEEIRRGGQELRDERNLLDQRVRERTAELQQANAQLAAARDEALEASLAKSAFLAQMSHELRTPLNAIIGYSELLLEEAEDDGSDASRPDLQKIIEAGRHLMGLINDILDLSKIEAGRMELYLEEVDVRAQIDAVVATVRPLARKNGNDLQLHCADDIGAMHSDSTRIRQVLLNLLSNACKFTEGGRVSLTVRREDRDETAGVVFCVQDTGIGMTPEQMARLFQSFVQANDPAARRHGGTGLGLVISRRFCELMGGGINVESEYGQGSTFTVWLPLRVAEPTTPTPSERAAGPRKPAPVCINGRAGGMALVIDDDDDARDLMRRYLEQAGFEVVTAAGGPEGLEAARSIQPTFIVLDVIMPGMDGWAVLSALKSDPQLCDIPVVMVTTVDSKAQGYALGASDYLVKPINRSRLTSLIEKYGRDRSERRAVLVIEDDGQSRDVLRRAFTAAGWTVSEAESAGSALRQVEQHRPVLILLDLMIPEMDGFEFLDELRKHPEYHATPVIVVTARELTDEERARLNGKVEQILQSQNLPGNVDQMLTMIRRAQEPTEW